MYLEKAQVVVNKALRKVVGAYDRCHVAHLHFFCGLWRVEALAKFRRLMTVARWFARRTQNEAAIRAYELAHRHELPFYMETQEIIEQLGIQQAWNKALVTFKTIDSRMAAELEREGGGGGEGEDEGVRTLEREQLRRQKGERSKALALRDLKKVIHAKIDNWEATWNRSLFPEGLCVLPRHCFPSPYMNHPLANFAFLRLVDVFDPPDVVEKNGGRINACWLCGQEEGDNYSHVLFDCGHRDVVDVRNRHLAVLEYARLENFINAWTNRPGRKSLNGMARRNERLNTARTNPKKVASTLQLLRELYQLRKKERYRKLAQERGAPPQ